MNLHKPSDAARLLLYGGIVFSIVAQKPECPSVPVTCVPRAASFLFLWACLITAMASIVADCEAQVIPSCCALPVKEKALLSTLGESSNREVQEQKNRCRV